MFLGETPPGGISRYYQLKYLKQEVWLFLGFTNTCKNNYNYLYN